MDRELKTALGAAAGLAAWLSAFIFLIRYAVPAILAARFSGSLILAVAVGVIGVLALVWAGWKLWIWVSHSLRR